MEHISTAHRINSVPQGSSSRPRTGHALQHQREEGQSRPHLRHACSIAINAALVTVLVASIVLAACIDELTGIRYINWLFFFTAYASALGLIKRFHPEDLGLDG